MGALTVSLTCLDDALEHGCLPCGARMLRLTSSAYTAGLAIATVRRFPATLTLGAWWSGKATA